MSKEEVKSFTQKLNTLEKTLECIDETKKSISKLDGAIACLREERHDDRKPNLPSYELAFDKELRRLTDAYDKEHKPDKVYMPDGLIWWFLFLTLPFVLACYSYFVEKGATIGKDVMIFFVAFAIGATIPVIVFFVCLYGKMSYKARVKNYFKRNRKRLKAIKSFEPDAERVAQKAKAEADRKYAEYERNQKENRKLDAQIENFSVQKRELQNTVAKDKALAEALFDELQTPKKYRSGTFLIAMGVHFHADKKDIEAGTMTAMDSLQACYKSLEKIDADYEIEQLAQRHAAREQAKVNAARARQQAEIRAREEAKREKEDRERREREEEAKRKRWKELDKWWEDVEAQ